MRTHELGRLVGRDLRRNKGALSTAGFGILAGTAALVFFLSLGLGVRAVLLGDVFPLDKIELEPQQDADPGLLSLVFGGGSTPRIDPAEVEKLRAMPEVKHVYPKLRFAFPASARGGKELIGRDVGTSEMVGDGVDPELVKADVHPSWTFEDPWKQPGKACTSRLGLHPAPLLRDADRGAAGQVCRTGSGTGESLPGSNSSTRGSRRRTACHRWAARCSSVRAA